MVYNLIKYLGPPLLLLVLILYLMLQGTSEVEAYTQIDTKDYISSSTYSKQVIYASIQTNKEVTLAYTKAEETTKSYSLPNYSSSYEDHTRFVDDIAPYAIWLYEVYNLYPSVTLAQCITESGWGQNAIGWNLGGVKDEYSTPGTDLEQHLVAGSEFSILLDGDVCSGGTCTYCGRKKILCSTYDGEVYGKRLQYFLFFQTPKEFFENRIMLFTEVERYTACNIVGQTSPEEQIRAIQEAGYSGGTYAQDIIFMFGQQVQWNVDSPVRVSDYDDPNSEAYQEARARAVELGLLES